MTLDNKLLEISTEPSSSLPCDDTRAWTRQEHYANASLEGPSQGQDQARGHPLHRNLCPACPLHWAACTTRMSPGRIRNGRGQPAGIGDSSPFLRPKPESPRCDAPTWLRGSPRLRFLHAPRALRSPRRRFAHDTKAWTAKHRRSFFETSLCRYF